MCWSAMLALVWKQHKTVYFLVKMFVFNLQFQFQLQVSQLLALALAYKTIINFYNNNNKTNKYISVNVKHFLSFY